MRPFTEGFNTALKGYRYLLGFLLLNLLIAWLGAIPFREGAQAVMGHSLLGERLLLRGLDLPTLIELLGRPDMGQILLGPLGAGVAFAVASLLLMPGVLQAYREGGHIPRQAFCAACSKHVWRFLRLAGLFLLAGGILAGVLGFAGGRGMAAADRSVQERLTFFVGLAATGVVFLVLLVLRMWFDLAQAHVVVRDQKAVRRSLAAAFRLLRAHGLRLLCTYLLVTVLAGAVLALGLRAATALLPTHHLLGAFVVTQALFLLLLAARFWQRAAALVVVNSSI